MAKRKTPFSVYFAILVLLTCAVVFLPSTILLAVCLLPTMVAALIEQSRPKTLWITVGALNFAGVFPAWFGLWEGGHTLSMAWQLIVQPRTLLIAYGGAAAGWVIYLNLTPMVAGFVAGRAKGRIKDIEARQKELIRKWGEEVAG